VDVRRRETQQPESSVDEQVLAPIVLDEPLAMVAAVVLENQPRGGIAKVCPSDEPSRPVPEVRLDLWAR